MRIEKDAEKIWGEVVLTYKDKECRFPFHIPSGEVFNHDPKPLVRFKCAALVVLTPKITLTRCIHQLCIAIFRAISYAYRYLDGQVLTQNDGVDIYSALSDSTRAIKYGWKLTKCAWSGIFNPYLGRLQYGLLERELNRHKDGPHRDKFYLAICFQRLWYFDEKDAETNTKVENKLVKYLVLIENIRKALLSCAFHQVLKELKIIRPAQYSSYLGIR